VKGYYIGGKDGTAEKVVNGRYSKKQVLNSFTAILPADNPKYQLLVMLDEPKRCRKPRLYHSGWNAVPTGGKVIARIAPLLVSSRGSICRVRPPYSCGIEDKPVRRNQTGRGAAPAGLEDQRLRDLFSADAAIEPQAEAVKVTGLAVDKRAVKPGDVFFALAGHKTDGSRFIESAIAAGAVAIAGDHAPPGDRRVPFWATRIRAARWRWPRRNFIRGNLGPLPR